MKTSTLIKSISLATLLTAALSTSVLAQMGNGPGMGQGRGGMRFSQTNTPGWTLMTQQERTDHMAQMRAARTFEECTQLQDAQHQLMQERAKEKGVTLNVPRQNGCNMMKARGFFN
ncbi:hypothetical protein [Rhodoferax sp. BLA1]|uniref:hypothetical protein n=1 Tax=Rhodoferax sp. BLA1 TaxID=2576062 RepID=UPI0015D2543C|nr:hypothetical protein [Rhodoferax sp. BLA1]